HRNMAVLSAAGLSVAIATGLLVKSGYLADISAEQRLLAAVDPGVILHDVQPTVLEGVNAYSTNRGLLLADLDRGVVIRGTLEDLHTGEDLVVTRSRALPFVGEAVTGQAIGEQKSAGPVTAAEALEKSKGSEANSQSESMKIAGQAVDREKLKGALAKRLSALRAESKPQPEPRAQPQTAASEP